MSKTLEQNLADAITIAATMHNYQFDKGGKPYILHPLKLMNELLYDTELAIIAVLHDVVEDSILELENLATMGLTKRVVDALELLTHNPEQSYEDYIEGICTNLDSITVKRKDLEHNSCITRLKGLTEKDTRRMIRYHKAFTRLGEARDTLRSKDDN